MIRNYHESRMELDPDGLVRQDGVESGCGNDGTPHSRGSRLSLFKPFRLLLAVSALFIIVLTIFCLYFPAGGDEDETGAISGIYDNLARMNEEMETLASDLEGSKDDLDNRLDGIAIELAGLSRKLDALAAADGHAVPPSTAGAVIHIVQKGENVFSIARHYGMPVNVLCKRNGITSSEIIHPGQRLFIQ